MGTFSIWHWLVVLVIVLLLFGAGKIPRLMGDMAKGVKAFKAGLKDEEAANAGPGSDDPKKALHAESAKAGAEAKDEAAKH